MGRNDIGEAARRTSVRPDADDVVGEPLNELATGRIGDEPAESVELTAFAASCSGECVPQQLIGARDRFFDQLSVVGVHSHKDRASRAGGGSVA